ncbi:MAG: FAD-binding oxidoreductase [Myxococcota bacterium]|nr:FAD-binding oxidoreductase [Myxococcota bacterium]
MNDPLEHLRRELGDAVRTEPELLAAHRADAWMMAELAAFEDRAGPLPLCVIEPRSTDEVAHALRVCSEYGIGVVPFGGGSGVCGAVSLAEGQVVLSTRALDGLVRLESRDLTAAFRAGTLGIEAERRVQREGLTIGHWPQSVELSTVGGWVATRAAGQYSTGYGNIEDVVLALEAVTPDGTVVRTRETPRAAAGPDLRHLWLGAEGTHGVVTEVIFSLRPLPEASRGQAFHFASLHAGLEPIRRALRAGWRPPVVRLYDARESRRHFRDHCPRDRALAIWLHEGPASAVAAEAEAVAALCREGGGVETAPAAVDDWLERRNHVASFREFLEQGVVVDTIEVAATWSRIGAVYDRVTAALAEVPGLLAGTAHSSHSYRSGTNLYFSFAARPDDPARLAETYAECWRRTLEATLAAGGSIAHHHGVGRVRRDWLEREVGPGGLRVLRAIKGALDPAGVLNPGNLLPDAG